MIAVSEEILPITKAKYPYVVKLEINWPLSIQHNGMTYHLTNKEATRNRDGMPCAEYVPADSGRRAWLSIDGEIQDDP